MSAAHPTQSTCIHIRRSRSVSCPGWTLESGAVPPVREMAVRDPIPGCRVPSPGQVRYTSPASDDSPADSRRVRNDQQEAAQGRAKPVPPCGDASLTARSRAGTLGSGPRRQHNGGVGGNGPSRTRRAEHRAWPSRWCAGGQCCAPPGARRSSSRCSGARSTAGAYGRYLKAINASDVQVNVPGILSGLPIMEPVTRLWSLPGAVSHATYVGLNALPVVRGKIDDSFLTNSIDGSVDGAGFTQDVMTVVSGKLPPLASTTGIV